MSDDIRLRQSTLIDGDKLSRRSVCVIGVGGVGSHTALALARMGVTNMKLCDDDAVDTHNVSSQGFNISEIGQKKVDVTAMKCFEAVRVMPYTIPKYITGDSIPEADVYVLAVDSMESKMEIMKAICAGSMDSIIIVPAMGAEYLTLDVYTGDTTESMKLFESRYFTDEEAMSDPCTAKATIYTTLLAGGFIAKAVKDIVMDKPYTSRLIYDIENNTPVLLKSSNGADLLS